MEYREIKILTSIVVQVMKLNIKLCYFRYESHIDFSPFSDIICVEYKSFK